MKREYVIPQQKVVLIDPKTMCQIFTGSGEPEPDVKQEIDEGWDWIFN